MSGKEAYTPPILEDGDSNRIYILGPGNIGRFFAHAIAKELSSPPLTLLVHRTALLKDWEDAGRKLEIIADGQADSTGVFEIEAVGPAMQGTAAESHPENMIQNLILTTKTSASASALSSISHRLNNKSTILLTQNGMGTIEDASSLFSSPPSRPTFLQSITSHGLYSVGPFRSVHAGKAHVTLCSEPWLPTEAEVEPRKGDEPWRYLLHKVEAAKILNVKMVDREEFTLQVLLKLFVNCCINPLSAILHLRNGEIFTHDCTQKLLAPLAAAFSYTILHHPLTANSSLLTSRFSSVASLIQNVVDAANATAANESSMLQDVKAGRKTEVREMNGWVVEEAMKLFNPMGLPSLDRIEGLSEEVREGLELHKELVDMVEEGARMSIKEAEVFWGDQKRVKSQRAAYKYVKDVRV